jgi:threonine/homoserine/homoserine lactone efflux protein
MSWDLALALVAFAVVMTATPGPNNLMLMASGVNFGLRRSGPHVAGVTLGVVFMVLVLGSGLGAVLARSPEAAAALKAASVVYMLWLAWKIATAAPPEAGRAPGRPLTFLQAAAFQWVNPKAWAMALTALGAYSAGEGWRAALPVALAFLVVSPPCNLLWVAMGQGLRRLLAERAALRAFNVAMALLLLASLWPVLRG